jgi:hypothetical protein
MGRNAQELLMQMDEDRDLRNGVGLEVDRLQTIEVDKPTKECSRRHAKLLLIERLEDDHLGPVLRGEFQAIVSLLCCAPPCPPAPPQ